MQNNSPSVGHLQPSSSFSATTTALLESKLAELSAHVSIHDLQQYLLQRGQIPQIPLNVFAQTDLAPLEALVKHLKEQLRYSNNQIAHILGRSNRTIWQTYANASKKIPLPVAGTSSIVIPLSIFTSSRKTVFEQLVQYLHQQKKISFRELGKLLNRNERTIWTVYSRALKKGDAA